MKSHYSKPERNNQTRIDDKILGKLSPKTQQSVFQTKTSGEKMLPLFKQVARQICKLTNDSSKIESNVKERPVIFDGNYKITKISCAELKEH